MQPWQSPPMRIAAQQRERWTRLQQRKMLQLRWLCREWAVIVCGALLAAVPSRAEAASAEVAMQQLQQRNATKARERRLAKKHGRRLLRLQPTTMKRIQRG